MGSLATRRYDPGADGRHRQRAGQAGAGDREQAGAYAVQPCPACQRGAAAPVRQRHAVPAKPCQGQRAVVIYR